jgi:uncharacterized protein
MAIPRPPSVGPVPSDDPAVDPTAARALLEWRGAYVDKVAGPRGPWSMAGLWWLSNESARLGSGESCELRLPARLPQRVATLARVGDEVLVTPSRPGALTIDGERALGPRLVASDGVELSVGEGAERVDVLVLRRGERVGARAFDPRQGAERDRGDVAWFAPTPGWVVDARLEEAAPGSTLSIVNLLGDVREAPLAGTLRFELAGRACALLAVDEGEALFVNFRDATSGVSTYAPGRFLRVTPGADGRARLDFHRAYHPPCAHTPFATCPLPPLANRLGVAVTAGERTAGEGAA